MTSPNDLSRRRMLAVAGAAALISGRAGAATEGPDTETTAWSAVAERAAGFDQLHAIVIRHRGEEVLAEAFRGPGLDRVANVKSVSKSIVALLTGIAIDRGELPGLDARLGDVAPRLIPSGADPQVPDITLGDLVTMRAGLERTSGPNYGAWVASRNWVADALSRPMVAEPGGRMLYSTGSFHVLGAVLAEATGDSLHAQARNRLARPLGIEIPPWTRDPQGRYLGGNEMAMSPRAMVRIGEMVRMGGTWQGERVVSEAWLDRSVEPVARSPWSGLGYGLGWFLGGRGARSYALARGYGGQVICVAPGLELTVAITSDPLQPARSAGYFGALMDLIEGPVMDAAA